MFDINEAYEEADFVIIAAPINYALYKNFFDTSTVEDVIALVTKYAPKAVIVIKSTVPVGYTKGIRKMTENKNIIFNPKFLRESKAIYDNGYSKFLVEF